MLTTRREFVRKSGSAVIATSLGFNILTAQNYKHKINVDTLKVGLIGCGGRGSGAALQATMSDPNVVLTAMADIFRDSLDKSYENLLLENPDKILVDEEHKFVGFDGYKQVLASDVDVVILTTPPSFRPAHLEAAIAAGKHVFCEKPVAVDAPGIRRVIASAQKAKEKGLALMSGFCWRHDTPKTDTYDRILDGAIGEVGSIYNTYNTGALWYKDRQDSWTDNETMMRNWLYFNWLSGDHIAEQAVHSLDLMAWAMGDKLPLSVSGTGGRQSRTEEKFGNVYDHFALTFDYGEGKMGHHVSRQQKGCSRAYDISMMGNKGRSYINVGSLHEIVGKETWKWDGERSNMYQNEHNTLFAGIRKGEYFNDGERAANSTMLAIMGRMAAYTGQKLTWEQAINSTEVLGPKIDEYNWKMDWPLAAVAQPGITEFI